MLEEVILHPPTGLETLCVDSLSCLNAGRTTVTQSSTKSVALSAVL